MRDRFEERFVFTNSCERPDNTSVAISHKVRTWANQMVNTTFLI